MSPGNIQLRSPRSGSTVTLKPHSPKLGADSRNFYTNNFFFFVCARLFQRSDHFQEVLRIHTSPCAIIAQYALLFFASAGIFAVRRPFDICISCIVDPLLCVVLLTFVSHCTNYGKIVAPVGYLVYLQTRTIGISLSYRSACLLLESPWHHEVYSYSSPAAQLHKTDAQKQ